MKETSALVHAPERMYIRERASGAVALLDVRRNTWSNLALCCYC